jgi:hypothetical protein
VAEHRAALLDEAFPDALSRAKAQMTDDLDLNSVLREYLTACLDADLEWRAMRPNGRELFGGVSSLPDLQFTAAERDQDAMAWLIGKAREALANRDTRAVAQRVDGLMKAHGLPEDLRSKLALGILEVHVHALEEMQRRCEGTVPLVFDPSIKSDPVASATTTVPPALPVTAPAASTLMAEFGNWARQSAG